MSNLSTIIEGIIFATAQPITEQQIIKIFPEEEKPSLGEVRKAIEDITEQYSERGIRLLQVASGYRFVLSSEVAPYFQRTLEEKPAKYSRALLETLALIAYRQPITRAEIEEIRGVAVSTNIVRTLTEQGWVRVVGHKEVPGRPALLATTKGFLDHFGLAHLEELPPLAELKDFDALVNAGDEVVASNQEDGNESAKEKENDDDTTGEEESSESESKDSELEDKREAEEQEIREPELDKEHGEDVETNNENIEDITYSSEEVVEDDLMP